MAHRSTQEVIDHSNRIEAFFDMKALKLSSAAEVSAVSSLWSAVIDRGKAEARVLASVDACRDAGVSWGVIGRTLGVSRQAAWMRYSTEGE